MNVYFREVQRFRQWWMIALLLLLPIPFVYLSYRLSVLGEQCCGKPIPYLPFLIITGVVLLLPAWLLSMGLITEVRDDELFLHFKFLWKPKRIPWRQIAQAEARRYSPIGEYGGWGIRVGIKGWAYNVSGNRGVQLKFENGEGFLIGSQRAEELAQAIQERMGDR